LAFLPHHGLATFFEEELVKMNPCFLPRKNPRRKATSTTEA
jgi:hypothetical protein